MPGFIFMLWHHKPNMSQDSWTGRVSKTDALYLLCVSHVVLREGCPLIANVAILSHGTWDGYELSGR